MALADFGDGESGILGDEAAWRSSERVGYQGRGMGSLDWSSFFYSKGSESLTRVLN